MPLQLYNFFLEPDGAFAPSGTLFCRGSVIAATFGTGWHTPSREGTEAPLGPSTSPLQSCYHLSAFES